MSKIGGHDIKKSLERRPRSKSLTTTKSRSKGRSRYSKFRGFAELWVLAAGMKTNKKKESGRKQRCEVSMGGFKQMLSDAKVFQERARTRGLYA